MRSGSPGIQSSHWTIAASRNQFYIALICLTVFHIFLAASFPPAEDELYYWSWAKSLQLSYYDHPPMVAYLIAFSTKLFGNNLFGIRFFGVLLGLVVLMLLRALSDKSQLLFYVCLTPVFFWGSIIMTPDVPLVFFWTCYLFWLVQVAKPLSNWSDDPVTRVYHPSPVAMPLWILGGVLLGLGILSKYSMFLAAPCCFLALVFRYRASAWVKGYFVHLVVAMLVAFPVIYYNYQHDFVSFRFQWGNAMSGSGNGISFASFFEYLGGQIIMVGALPFIMLPWILLWRPEIRDNPKLDVLFYFFVPTICFFALQSFRTKLEANWGLVTYLAFWPLAQSLMDRTSFKTFALGLRLTAFIAPIVVSLAIAIHLVTPLKIISPAKDRLTRLRSQLHLSQEVARELGFMETIPVFLPSYQWTAYLKYQGVNAHQAFPSGKMSHYTMKPVDACQFPSVFFFSPESEPGVAAPALSCFKNKTRIKVYDLSVRGELIHQFYLDRYSK